jgi:DNA-binding IscR family transcriptional regulator
MNLSHARTYAVAGLIYLIRKKIEAVDGLLRALAEPVGDGEGKALDKRLQVVWDEAVAVVRERLAKITLAELARGK